MANFSRGRRSDKAWLGMPGSVVQSSAVGTKIFAGSLAFTSPGTILRTRGVIKATFDETAQIGDTMFTSFGLGIVSTDAATVGASAMPDPGDEADYPWLWYGQILLRSNVAAGPTAYGPAAEKLEVDSKAMRRFKPGQSLVLVMEHAQVSGAPITEFDMSVFRVLIATT